LSAAAPEQALNKEVSVRQLLDSARQQLEQRGALDPKVRQPVQRMLGRLYTSIGEYQKGAELLEAGSRNVEPNSREEALALADDLVAYADALGNMEKGAASVAVSEQAAALRIHFAPDDPEQQLRAQAFQTLGHVEKYGWEVCRKRGEQALAMAMRMPNPPVDVVLRLYSDLSSVANFTNDRRRLMQLSEEGLAFADRHHGPYQSPQRFTLLRSRIESVMMDGRLSEAEALSREAIAMAEKTGGVGSTRLSVLYSELGGSLHAQGRYREAQAALQRSSELTRQTDGGPRNVAMSLANMAMVNAAMGDPAAAMRLVDQAFHVLDQAGIASEDTFRITTGRVRIHVLLEDNRIAQANARLGELLPLVRDTQGKDSGMYSELLNEQVDAARRARDVVRGTQVLADARALAAKIGVSATSVMFARFLRTEAAFSRQRGDLPAAERAQREALQMLQSTSNTFDIALARAELAELCAERGDKLQASALLVQALPVMRNAVLPQQSDLKTAEALASRLGLAVP
jgi:serine/threonine-protein kinase